MSVHKRTKTTLCWDCKNAVKGCSWSKDFIPVDGWKAKKTYLRPGEKRGKPIESYIVEKCPQFVEG